MKGKFLSRFLSVLLAALMVVAPTVQLGVFAAPELAGTVEKVQEENGETNNTDMQLTSSPDTITVSEVESRIKQLKTLLNNKYFTVNQKACTPDATDISCGYHGWCEPKDSTSCNCLNANIIATDWFKDMFGETSVSNFPGIGGTSRAWTCAGFGNFAMWYLFKSTADTSSCSDKVTVTQIFNNVPMTNEYLAQLKPGDGIFATKFSGSTHTFVFISKDAYFDCNGWNAGTSMASIVEFYEGTNIISNRYSGSYTMSVYRATNYDTAEKVKVAFEAENSKYSIGETNAVISSKMTVSGGATYKDATEVGVYLYDNFGNELATMSEEAYTEYDGYLLSWYDINRDLGETLKPGTTYKFKFFVVIGGNTYYEDMRSFTTTGNASYTITFNPNGGSVSTSNKTVTNNSTYGSLPTPTRTGYIFDGWYTSASGGTIITGNSTVNLIDNQTLYAHWTPMNYTVSYNANGGSGAPATQTKTYGVNLTLSSTKPTKTGYTFKGWSTANDSTVEYASGATYSANSGVTLYAVWQANTYTVKYNANGGSGSMSNSTHTYDTAKALTSNAFTRSGYSFLGWATDSSATSAKYTNGQSVKNLSSTTGATVNLYAVWSEIPKYTVSYNANGGSGAPASQTKTYGVNLTLSSTKPTKTGYTFKGWSTANDSTVEYASGATYSENNDVTLYAVWQANTYTVSYDANGGSGVPANQTKTHDVNLTLSTTAPTRDGYTFKGWATSADSEVEYASGASYSANEDVTLYAVWKSTFSLKYTGNLIIPLQINERFPEREFDVSLGRSITYIYAWVDGSCKYVPIVTDYAYPEIIDNEFELTPEYNGQLCTYTVNDDGFYTIKSLGYDVDDETEDYIGIEKHDITVLDSENGETQFIVLNDTDVTISKISDTGYVLEGSSLDRSVDLKSSTIMIVCSFDWDDNSYKVQEYPGFTSDVTFDSVTYVVENNPDSKTKENLLLLFATTSQEIASVYRVTYSYNADGNGVVPASQLKTYGTALTLSTTAPTRDGYTFKGWATSADGEVEYASGASYTANEDVTLYAVWEEVVPASYDAYIYTEAKQKAVQGSQFTAKVYLEGTYDGYSFTLLPIDGLEILDITASGSGIYVDELSEGWMVSVLGGLAKTDSEKTEIVTVTVHVAEDALVGTRLLALSDVMISNDMGDKVSGVKYVYASIEITDQIPGDINGDGKFDYYDVSKLFAYFRKKTTLDASVDTDVNGDGKFDYYDVSKLYAIFRGKAAFN